MDRGSRYKCYAYQAATIAVACLVSVIAWLDNRGITHLTQPFVGHPAEAWIGTAFLVVTMPGWFIVTSVKANGPANRLTDFLIPMLSGVFWGLLAILVAKLIKFLTRLVRPAVG